MISYPCFQAAETSSHNEDVSEITVSVQWSEQVEPNKKKAILEKALQTWFSKMKKSCRVEHQPDNGNFNIRIEPASSTV